MAAPLLPTGAVESCVNPGTGGFTLLGPANALRRRFRDDARMSSGRQVWYCATDGTQVEWGVGTFTAGTNGASDTLSRDTVTENTAGNTSKLNFTGNLSVFASHNGWAHPVKDLSGAAWTGINNDQLIATDASSSLVIQSFGDGSNQSYSGDADGSMSQVGPGVYFTATTARMACTLKMRPYLDGGNYTIQQADVVTIKGRVQLWDSGKSTVIDHLDDVADLTGYTPAGKIVIPYAYPVLTPGTSYLVVCYAAILGTNNNAVRYGWNSAQFRLGTF